MSDCKVIPPISEKFFITLFSKPQLCKLQVYSLICTQDKRLAFICVARPLLNNFCTQEVNRTQLNEEAKTFLFCIHRFPFYFYHSDTLSCMRSRILLNHVS